MNPYAMQMLYPLTGQTMAPSTAAQVDRSAGIQQQQQQNLMVQYALTGQSNGDPFPSVSFANNKNQMDSVSCLSTTTGGYVSSVARPSKPAAYVATGTTQQPGRSATSKPSKQSTTNGSAPPTWNSVLRRMSSNVFDCSATGILDAKRCSCYAV